MVIQEGKEKNLAFLFGVGRVWKFGAVHGIALPQVAKMVALEAAVGFGALFVKKLRGGGVSSCQLAAQGTSGKSFLGDRLRGIEAQHADNRAGGAQGLLAFERLSAVEGSGGNGPWLALV